MTAQTRLENGEDAQRGSSRDAVISVTGLAKRYGEVEAVRGIDFEVERGETFGFLGPNGAGKTTTIKILCTLANATAGSALVAGHDSATSRDAVRRNIGLVFQDTTLDSYLTAEQNPAGPADLRGRPDAARGVQPSERVRADGRDQLALRAQRHLGRLGGAAVAVPRHLSR